jgi:hypothetical protein
VLAEQQIARQMRCPNQARLAALLSLLLVIGPAVSARTMACLPVALLSGGSNSLPEEERETEEAAERVLRRESDHLQVRPSRQIVHHSVSAPKRASHDAHRTFLSVAVEHQLRNGLGVPLRL